jgi:cytochrome c553
VNGRRLGAPVGVATKAAAALATTLALLAAVDSFAQTKKPARAASAASSPGAAAASNYAQRFASDCSGCHGSGGRSDIAGVPVLAGQHSLYAITQLFLFREGRRDYAPMVALAKPMKDDDLRGYSDFIGTLPAIAPPQPSAPPDAQRMRVGQLLADKHRCHFCHGNDLAGGQQVPRIGGQKEEYLRMTLHGFKSGQRPAYTRAMTEALSQVPDEDLDVIATWVAHARSGAADAATR